FKGDKERFLYIRTRDLVVLAPCIGDQVGIALAVSLFELALLLDPVFEGPQHVDRVDAARVRPDQRRGDAVNNKARRNAIHALTFGLLLDLLDVFLPEAFD